MVVQNVENGILKFSNRNRHIRSYHKNLNKEQQSELKCKIHKTIVYDYLKTISEYNSKYPN